MKIRNALTFALTFCALVAAILLVAGCGDKATTRDIAPGNTATTTDEHADHGHDLEGNHAATPAAQPAGTTGKVRETMDSGGYTYVKLSMADDEVWVAGPVTAGIEVGREIGFSGAMEMRDFHAKSLDRTFDRILFVSGFTGAGTANPHGGTPGVDQPLSGTKTKLENAHVEGVRKADGGYTIAEVYDRAAELKNQEVAVRGRIVKFSRNIMGTNWMHIQDGSGDDDTSDLTVTTDGHGQVGDIVLVKGPLSVDKDFGAGYRYHVIIEGASVTKE
ncbi:DNA-binding protein [bacterium DOLZORAL124_64_63]|nr:MAG: DNA-binding protein [bacterium DOLZORAL124_64_63]